MVHFYLDFVPRSRSTGSRLRWSFVYHGWVTATHLHTTGLRWLQVLPTRFISTGSVGTTFRFLVHTTYHRLHTVGPRFFLVHSSTVPRPRSGFTRDSHTAFYRTCHHRSTVTIHCTQFTTRFLPRSVLHLIFSFYVSHGSLGYHCGLHYTILHTALPRVWLVLHTSSHTTVHSRFDTHSPTLRLDTPHWIYVHTTRSQYGLGLFSHTIHGYTRMGYHHVCHYHTGSAVARFTLLPGLHTFTPHGSFHWVHTACTVCTRFFTHTIFLHTTAFCGLGWDTPRFTIFGCSLHCVHCGSFSALGYTLFSHCTVLHLVHTVHTFGSFRFAAVLVLHTFYTPLHAHRYTGFAFTLHHTCTLTAGFIFGSTALPLPHTHTTAHLDRLFTDHGSTHTTGFTRTTSVTHAHPGSHRTCTGYTTLCTTLHCSSTGLPACTTLTHWFVTGSLLGSTRSVHTAVHTYTRRTWVTPHGYTCTPASVGFTPHCGSDAPLVHTPHTVWVRVSFTTALPAGLHLSLHLYVFSTPVWFAFTTVGSPAFTALVCTRLRRSLFWLGSAHGTFHTYSLHGSSSVTTFYTHCTHGSTYTSYTTPHLVTTVHTVLLHSLPFDFHTTLDTHLSFTTLYTTPHWFAVPHIPTFGCGLVLVLVYVHVATTTTRSHGLHLTYHHCIHHHLRWDYVLVTVTWILRYTRSVVHGYDFTGFSPHVLRSPSDFTVQVLLPVHTTLRFWFGLPSLVTGYATFTFTPTFSFTFTVHIFYVHGSMGSLVGSLPVHTPTGSHTLHHHGRLRFPTMHVTVVTHTPHLGYGWDIATVYTPHTSGPRFTTWLHTTWFRHHHTVTFTTVCTFIRLTTFFCTVLCHTVYGLLTSVGLVHWVAPPHRSCLHFLRFVHTGLLRLVPRHLLLRFTRFGSPSSPRLPLHAPHLYTSHRSPHYTFTCTYTHRTWFSAPIFALPAPVFWVHHLPLHTFTCTFVTHCTFWFCTCHCMQFLHLVLGYLPARHLHTTHQVLVTLFCLLWVYTLPLSFYTGTLFTVPVYTHCTGSHTCRSRYSSHARFGSPHVAWVRFPCTHVPPHTRLVVRLGWVRSTVRLDRSFTFVPGSGLVLWFGSLRSGCCTHSRCTRALHATRFVHLHSAHTHHLHTLPHLHRAHRSGLLHTPHCTTTAHAHHAHAALPLPVVHVRLHTLFTVLHAPPVTVRTADHTSRILIYFTGLLPLWVCTARFCVSRGSHAGYTFTLVHAHVHVLPHGPPLLPATLH